MKTAYSSPSIYPDQPRAAAGAIVFKEERVLLVLRGQSPAENMWAIPGGSIKLGETLQQAAEREVYEETGLVVRAREPVLAFDSIVRDDSGQVRFHYVIVDLIADYVSGEPKAGDDALDARWVSAQEMKNLNVNSKTEELLRDHFGWE